MRWIILSNAKNEFLPTRTAMFLCPFYAEMRAHDSLACVASVFACGFGARNDDRESKTKSKLSLSFHSSRGQNRKPCSSVFLCCETKRKTFATQANNSQSDWRIFFVCYGYDLECLWRFQKRKSYKKRTPSGPASTAGEAIEKMLVEKRISLKINYEVLRDLETSQSSKPALPDKPAAEPVIQAKQEFLTPRVPTRTGGRKRLG